MTFYRLLGTKTSVTRRNSRERNHVLSETYQPSTVKHIIIYYVLYFYRCFSENRYLLILTENYAALRIIEQHLLKTSEDAVVIFGSSFPNDQEYTQVKWTTGI